MVDRIFSHDMFRSPSSYESDSCGRIGSDFSPRLTAHGAARWRMVTRTYLVICFHLHYHASEIRRSEDCP